MSSPETLFAVSTAPGRSGVAVIRVSGPLAGDALRALGGTTDRPRQARLVSLVHPQSGEMLDRALTLWFAGPASFTGEDVAEFQVHGGPAVVAAVLDALSGVDGLVFAEPGGFTRQAFGNGKLDLTAVEGLADLIAAQTERQRKMALRQMEGTLLDLYQGWRVRLIRCLAHTEAGIDFADEDVPEDLAGVAMGDAQALAETMSCHLEDGRKGERLRSGYRVVLAGPPNAGKSSLLNALVRRDAAIVSAEPGTTRDIIDVSLDLGGYPVEITDTAGIRETENAIEVEGVSRAMARAGTADLVIWLNAADGGEAPDPPPDLIGDVLAVISKSDLLSGPADGIAISVVTEAGLEPLLDQLKLRVSSSLGGVEDGMITRFRHRNLVERARDSLAAAVEVDGMAPELVAENLRAAADDLGRLTGRVDVEDLLDVIFAEFCIGK